MSRSRSHTGKSDHQIDLFAEDTGPEPSTMTPAGDASIDWHGDADRTGLGTVVGFQNAKPKNGRKSLKHLD